MHLRAAVWDAQQAGKATKVKSYYSTWYVKYDACLVPPCNASQRGREGRRVRKMRSATHPASVSFLLHQHSLQKWRQTQR